MRVSCRVMMARSRLWWFSVAGVAALAMACDGDVGAALDAGGDLAPGKADDGLGCAGPQPVCVHACSDPSVATTARCDGGVWRCEVGIRGDFCCDPSVNPALCPAWGGACGPESACSAGYTCVRSRFWPIPDESGTCRLGDWRLPAALTQCGSAAPMVSPGALLQLPEALVQVEGVVRTAMRCDDRRCSPSEPCCQQCTGSYTLELAPPGEAPYWVALRTETLSCAGTNCGFSCAPLQPGRRYRLWGLWNPEAAPGMRGLIYLAGFCRDTP